MNAAQMKKHSQTPPFLHILKPIHLEGNKPDNMADGRCGTSTTYCIELS